MYNQGKMTQVKKSVKILCRFDILYGKNWWFYHYW